MTTKGLIILAMATLLLLPIVASNDFNNSPSGRCPPDDIITTCEFDPDVNCSDDVECDPGFGCCPNGCSSICKRLI